MKYRLVAIAGLLAMLATETRADPMYSGTANAVLTLDSISGGPASSLIALPAMNDDTSHSTSGGGFLSAGLPTASATTTFTPVTPAAGNTVTLESVIGGGVSGSGASNSLATSTGTLSVFNNSSSDTITLSFTFDYRYTVQASTTSSLETASTTGIVSLKATTNLGDTPANLFLTPSANASNGSMQTTQSSGYPSNQTLTFSVVLSPGELATINLRADITGNAAITAVPEPTSLALVGLGLATIIPLSLRRRRRPERSPALAA